ncbi:MAG: type VI secretion system contractile sheath large subunit [Acidobacteriota bacterium]
MPKRYDFGEAVLDVSPDKEPAAVQDSEKPFRIAILGDFSGRANRGICEPGGRLAGRRAVAVDRDSFDLVLARFSPAIQLGPHISFRFNELDDFHPDRIYAGLDVFRRLRETRAKLGDAATFRAAAAEIGFREPAPPADLARLTSGDLLEDMIQATESRAEARRPDELAQFVRRVVAPYVTPSPHPKQKQLVAQVDAAIGGLMRGILHHRDVQALEAAWRAVLLLVRRLETNGTLKLYLIDLSKEELAADLSSAQDLRQTGLYRLLVEETVETPGADPWAVVAGIYSFEQSARDVQLLGRLAKIAQAAEAPLLAEAGAQAADAEGEQAWSALRASPEASYIGLALPRFLLRLPYGRETDPIEQFDFEEMAERPQHPWYLWGNPAFFCAYLLGRAFSLWAWSMRPGMIQEIDGLPAHVYQEEGEQKMKPCAELLLTQDAVEEILEAGLMPLISFKNRDVVRLARFQSIAKPERPLSGRWG